jgi:prepilin-type N-terminal cleavage/methylation domain-containing protein
MRDCRLPTQAAPEASPRRVADPGCAGGFAEASCRLPAELKRSGRPAFAIVNRKSEIVNAFTLIELLVVISILGILAALTVPALKNLGKSNSAISASRQLLQAVGRARQLAIEHHTTVFMIFMPTNFWGNANWLAGLSPAQRIAATSLCDMQLSGYTFVANGSAGDQPGRHVWHYLEPWQSLPDGSFIASWKFNPPGPLPAMVINDAVSGQPLFNIYGFSTNAVPFPTADLPLTMAVLPCIAFNYLGQLTTPATAPAPATQHEYIPLARGSVYPVMDANKALQFGSPSVSELPPGNSTSSAFNLVDIDPLTGRATLRFQKVQ